MEQQQSRMDWFPTDKVLQKWNVGSFQSESQTDSTKDYQRWVLNYDASYLGFYQPKYFWWHHCLPTFSVLIIFGDQLYSLHKKKMPQEWEMKWELYLHVLHWHSHYYIDTGVTCNSQHMYFITGKCWRSFADRELNHYLLKWDSLPQASTILNVGVKIQLVLQDFFCSPQYHYLHHVIQSHLQQLLKRGEINSTFKLLLSLLPAERTCTIAWDTQLLDNSAYMRSISTKLSLFLNFPISKILTVVPSNAKGVVYGLIIKVFWKYGWKLPLIWKLFGLCLTLI